MQNTPKMIAYRRDFDETKYMSFLIKIKNCWKNIMNSGIKSATASKKNFIANLYALKNI